MAFVYPTSNSVNSNTVVKGTVDDLSIREGYFCLKFGYIYIFIYLYIYVYVITPYECYIRFIITEHEGHRPKGEVIIILI